MDIVLWIIVIAGFILSYVALIFPVLPGLLFFWISILTYHFFIDSGQLTLWFWLTMVVFTAVLLVSDIIINSKSVKRFGGTKWGERMAAVGVILGSFIFPPFGIILLPFILVFITELVQKKKVDKAATSAFGALVGFLAGTVAAFLLTTIMIISFFVSIWLW
ncbi:DUF456 domain-containing protein [Pontibacillus litoralis]|uniref:Membrane protein n=1 Tax=Pontibacillus litoralis JSM 072002 TaxID=1385512 RepID=A0A0A5HVD3_9BACI|nr:DUF456 family protein [Pontibacillus litoralis]KGX87587.1 membrane protein [Pontibacillus litoralis JSM 072002]